MKERQAMGKIPVSVIIPAKNEKNNIVQVINELKDWAAIKGSVAWPVTKWCTAVRKVKHSDF